MHKEHSTAPQAPPAPAPTTAPEPATGAYHRPTVPQPGAAPGAGPGAASGRGARAAGARAPRGRVRRFSGASASGGRDPFLDNAKFLLVVLVAMGHGWEPFVEGMRGVRSAYLLLYAFHMPAFVLLCGYFSRGFTGRPDQVRKLLVGVLLPYVVFETVYAGVYTLFLDQPFAVTPTEPRSVCWFLAALFIWRLTAPVWRAMRRPVAVAAALSVGAGLTDLGSELALSRVLMFLPWFVLGLRLRSEHLRPLRNPAARRWALPLMVLAAVGAYWAAPRVDRRWLLMTDGSAQLGVPPHLYVAVRLGLFVGSAVLLAAFLALVPSRRTGFTALGAVTVYPFLLHGLLVKSVEGLGGYGPVFTGGLVAVAATTLVTGALAVLLGSAPVRRALWPLIEPRFPGWLNPDDVAQDRADGRAGGPATRTRGASRVRPRPARNAS